MNERLQSKVRKPAIPRLYQHKILQILYFRIKELWKQNGAPPKDNSPHECWSAQAVVSS